MPLLIHKEIQPRFMKVGKDLELLHNKAYKIEDEIRAYYDNTKSWADKFHALNNSIPAVEKTTGLNPEEKHKRTETIFAIFDLVKADVPKMLELTYHTKPKIDFIFALGDEMTQIADSLIKTKDDLPASLQIVDELEEKFKAAEENYAVAEGRLRYLKQRLEEQKKLYFSIIN
jgi:hypothetical protein